MRISDWSSDVCSSDLGWPAANLLASLLEIEMADRSSRCIQRHRDQSGLPAGKTFATFDFDAAPGIRKPHLLSLAAGDDWIENGGNLLLFGQSGTGKTHAVAAIRSEEHTSELQSLMRISYAVFCLQNTLHTRPHHPYT